MSGILILSLGIRLAYLYQISSTPVFGFYAADSQYHDKFALKILGGDLTFKEAIYLNGLYSFILAAIYKFAGHSLWGVGLFQALIDTLTGIFLYLICAGIFHKRGIGILAFFIYSCYALSIFYTGIILETTLSAFLFTGAVLLLLYAARAKRGLPWLLSGFILGLSTLLRANVVLVIPFLFFWVYIRQNRKALRTAVSCALVFTGILAAALPFSLRNYAIAKSLSPFPVNGGINFYIGNHSGATGIYTPIGGISDSAVYQVKQSILKARLAAGRDLSASEASNYWFLKGIAFIKNNPYQYARLTLKKLYLFWNKLEVPGNENFYFCKTYVPMLRFPLFSFGLMAPFAILGIILAVKRKERGLYLVILSIIAYALSITLFFMEARYRFPVVGLMIIMASYALYESRKNLLFLAGLTLLFLFVNAKAPVADPGRNVCANYNNLGASFYEKGQMGQAIAEYKKALEANPDYAPTYNNLASAYYKLGENEKSIKLYARAIELNPDFVEAYYGLANAYSEAAKINEAIAMYKKVIMLDPAFVEAYNNLGYLYAGAGRYDEAETVFSKLLNIDPKYIKAYNNLGILYARSGRTAGAIKLFEKAIELDPDYQDAYHNLARARGQNLSTDRGLP